MQKFDPFFKKTLTTLYTQNLTLFRRFYERGLADASRFNI